MLSSLWRMVLGKGSSKKRTNKKAHNDSRVKEESTRSLRKPLLVVRQFVKRLQNRSRA